MLSPWRSQVQNLWGGVGLLIGPLSPCDKARSLGGPGIEARPSELREVLAPAKSQVIGISSLQAVGYTLGRLLFPMVKKNNNHPLLLGLLLI